MTRNEAIAAGLVFYETGRPCGKGHNGRRYTSNGMCEQCLKERATKTAVLSKQARARRNIALASGVTEYVITVQRKHAHLIERINDIMLDVHNPRNAELLSAYITLITDSSVNNEQLRTVLEVSSDNNRVLNHAHHPTRCDAAGAWQIELFGNWYYANEVMECLQGKRATVERVPGEFIAYKEISA